MKRKRQPGERGQTTTEYLMILALVTAIVVSLENIVVPAMRWAVTVLLKHIALCLSAGSACVAR